MQSDVRVASVHALLDFDHQYSLLGGDVYADLRAALDAAVPVAA